MGLEDYYQYESGPEQFKHDIDFFGEQDKIVNKHEHQPPADFFAGFENESKHLDIVDETMEPVTHIAKRPVYHQTEKYERLENVPLEERPSNKHSNEAKVHEDIIYKFLADMKKRKEIRNKTVKSHQTNKKDGSSKKMKNPQQKVNRHKKKKTKKTTVTKSLPRQTPNRKKKSTSVKGKANA